MPKINVEHIQSNINKIIFIYTLLGLKIFQIYLKDLFGQIFNYILNVQRWKVNIHE